MNPSIKFTSEKPEIICENKMKIQVSNFLDAKILLHEDNSVKLTFITNHQILTNTYHTIVYTLIMPQILSPTTQLKEL